MVCIERQREPTHHFHSDNGNCARRSPHMMKSKEQDATEIFSDLPQKRSVSKAENLPGVGHRERLRAGRLNVPTNRKFENENPNPISDR
jgi:hypothetical protein